MSNNESNQSHLNLAQVFRIPFQTLVTELHERLAKVGFGDIRPTHTIIFALVGTEGIRLGELAERAQLTKQLVNYLVTAVEEMGYVERIPDPLDGRGKLVRLTEKGARAAREGSLIIKSIEEEWTTLIGEKTMQEIRSGVELLIGKISEERKP